jgi:hypothetical protein
MTSSSQKNHAYLYDKKFTSHAHNGRYYDNIVSHNVVFNPHAMVASSSTYAYGKNKLRKACTGTTTVYHACNASFVLSCKNAKVVARKLGSKYKGDKTCIWVPKVFVTNLIGPNKSWVPKTEA